MIVVDGSHKEALALCAHLSIVGIECRAVFGTVDAIDLGRGWVPHVIVMDVSIAQYGGIDAVRMLRNDPRTCGIAIIAYTALNETDVRRRLTDVKLDGYLQKGRPLVQLVALVKALVQRRSQVCAPAT